METHIPFVLQSDKLFYGPRTKYIDGRPKGVDGLRGEHMILTFNLPSPYEVEAHGS